MRGRPSNTVAQAERVVRNYQLSQGDEHEGVTIPVWLFFLGIGIGIGVITGPSLMALSESGALRLRQMAEEKLRK